MRPCECGCDPVLRYSPDLGGMYEVRCNGCGATTGYTFEREDAREHWEHGDVATFRDWMKEMASE